MASLDPKALFNIHTNTNVSMTSTVTSQVIDIREARTVAAQLIWISGSTPVGSFSFQCSNDGTNFTEIGAAPVSGNTGTSAINFELPGFFFARVQYIPSSGIATGDIWMSAKS